ncbi:unnamed protein product, partial [Laminaria digitata]
MRTLTVRNFGTATRAACGASSAGLDAVDPSTCRSVSWTSAGASLPLLLPSPASPPRQPPPSPTPPTWLALLKPSAVKTSWAPRSTNASASSEATTAAVTIT